MCKSSMYDNEQANFYNKSASNKAAGKIESMLRSRKGQWFLVSAVIITGSLLSISLVFKNYFITDTSSIVKMNEDYLVLDLESQFAKIIAAGYDQPGCDNLTREMNEFIAFSEEKISERGRLLEITYAVDCGGERTDINIFLGSDEMNITKSIRL